VEKQWIFDSDFARSFTRVRQAFAATLLEGLRKEIDLTSALDVGCGVGYFSGFLAEMGFQVVAVDGREENAQEGKRRYPDITFLARDAEDPTLPELGTFDFVLCAGLLYHLENPFRAIRSLHALTGKVLLLESMCIPGDGVMMELLDEGRVRDQGLEYVAFYPTESCLIKMLYRAGFPCVYRFQRLPDDAQYISTISRKRARTFLLASKMALAAPNLALAKEPFRLNLSESDPWVTVWSRVRSFCAAKLWLLRVFAANLLKRWRKRGNLVSPGADGESK
jgi:SAM-dependent methyltransferase